MENVFDCNFWNTNPIKIIFNKMKTTDQGASIAAIIPTFIETYIFEDIWFYNSPPSEKNKIKNKVF